MLGSLEENENQNRTKQTKEVQTHRRGSSAVLLSAAVSLYRYVKSTHKATGKRGEVKCPILTNTNSLPSCKKRKEKRNPVWNLPSRRDNNNGLYLVFTHFAATWSKLL